MQKTVVKKTESGSSFDPGAILMIFYTTVIALIVCGSALTAGGGIMQYEATDLTDMQPVVQLPSTDDKQGLDRTLFHEEHFSK